MSQDFKALKIIMKMLKKTNNLLDSTDLDDEKIAFFREDVRKNIFFIQDELAEKYSKTIIQFILFPVIAYIDEKIMFKNNDGNINWPILQLEYYGKKNGGEYVFELIDNLLSDKIYPIICYQVIFLILEENFVGKYYEITFDHNYLSYKKKIKKLLDGNRNDENKDLNYINNIKVKKDNNYNLNFHWVLKIVIPIILTGISVTLFII